MLFNFQGLNSEKQITLYGGVAQLGEHLPCKQGVMGSIPIISTTGCAGALARGSEQESKTDHTTVKQEKLEELKPKRVDKNQ